MRLDERRRSELLAQSRNAKTTKSYKSTRYARKDKISVFNDAKSFNSIDMNALWKADLLSFLLSIHGETSDYKVEILFDGVCKDIQREVKLNNDICEYKCIYRAIIKAINNQDMFVGCSCDDWKFRFQYWGTKGRYNSMKSQLVPASQTNPNNDQGAACKHVLKVLADLDWALELATCINNYAIMMEEKFPDKFAEIIYPAIHGHSYEAPVEEPEEEVEEEEPIEEPEEEIEQEEEQPEEGEE